MSDRRQLEALRDELFALYQKVNAALGAAAEPEPVLSAIDAHAFVEFVTVRNENLGEVLRQSTIEVESGRLVIVVDPMWRSFVALHRRILEGLYVEFAGIKLRALVVELV